MIAGYFNIALRVSSLQCTQKCLKTGYEQVVWHYFRYITPGMVFLSCCGRDLIWRSIFSFPRGALLPMSLQDHMASIALSHGSSSLMLRLGNFFLPAMQILVFLGLGVTMWSKLDQLDVCSLAWRPKPATKKSRIWFTLPVNCAYSIVHFCLLDPCYQHGPAASVLPGSL